MRFTSMSKLILCSGVRSSRPYIIEGAGFKVYSIEELCYYLGSHLYLVEDSLFCDALMTWIAQELQLPERAAKLKEIQQKKGDVKALFTALLCSCDYYTEAEIIAFIRSLDGFLKMSPIRRSSLKADNYLKSGKYFEAKKEYEKILNSEHSTTISPEDYGDLLHNLGVSMVHTRGFRDAVAIFYEAYLRNQKKESLHTYLYSIALTEDSQQLEEKFNEYQIADDIRTEILFTIEQRREKAKEEAKRKELDDLFALRNEGDYSYQEKIDTILYQWMDSLRNNI